MLDQRTTIQFLNYETGKTEIIEYLGRIEIKYDHVWLNHPVEYRCIAVFKRHVWWAYDEEGSPIETGPFTDIIVRGMEAV